MFASNSLLLVIICLVSFHPPPIGPVFEIGIVILPSPVSHPFLTGNSPNSCTHPLNMLQGVSMTALQMFTLKLEAKQLPSTSVIQEILEDVSQLYKLSQDIVREELITELSPGHSEQVAGHVDNILRADTFACILSYQGSLRSRYMRKGYYHEHFFFVEHLEISLGWDAKNDQRPYHYVPILKTLEVIMHDDSLADHISLGPEKGNGLIYSDLSGGVVLRSKSFPPEGHIQLILYQDALEVVNLLGAARGKFKVLAVYLTLGNIAPYISSELNLQQLALLCLEKDFRHFGCCKVFERLLSDRKYLEDVGVEVHGKQCKASVAFIAGDNLGSHCVEGFTENFSSSPYFCRYCLLTLKEFKAGETQRVLRTVESYKDAVQRLQEEPEASACMGIKFDSPFNALRSFHVCQPGLPPCVGHDVLERIVDFDLALIIQYLVKKLKWFTYHQLNAIIQRNFKYNTADLRNKPAPVLVNGRNLGGEALQNYTLLLLLPVMIGDKVQDTTDEVWALFLILQEVVEFIMAPVITENQIFLFSSLISEYIAERRRLFPGVPLRPKHHYVTHYPFLIQPFGSLIHVWTMRFESKQKYLKRCVRATGNFKNVTETLSVKHQLMHSYLLESGLSRQKVDIKDSYPLDVRDEAVLEGVRSEHQGKQLPLQVSEVTICGTSYKPGNYVVLGGGSISLVFGKLVLIVVSPGSKETQFVVECTSSTYQPGFRFYQLLNTGHRQLSLMSPSSLKDSHAHSAYNILHHSIFRLKIPSCLMKMLAKLWSFDRKVRKLAPIESFEDLKKKAIEVGVSKESPDIKVYLEDETEVNEGAFKYISDAHVQECSTFVVSTTPWTSVTEPVGGSSRPDSTVSVLVGFVNSVTFRWESLSATVLTQLRNGKQLDKKAVHELVRMVVISMEKAKQRPSARYARCVADYIVKMYGQLADPQMHDLKHAPTSEGLAHKIQARSEITRRGLKRTLGEALTMNDSQPERQSLKTEYGCVEYQLVNTPAERIEEAKVFLQGEALKSSQEQDVHKQAAEMALCFPEIRLSANSMPAL